MRQQDLKQLMNEMSIQEKVAQTIQVNGQLVGAEGMATGPRQELGYPETLVFNQVGSIFNVTDPEQVRQLQKKAVENSPHHIPYLFMADVIYGFRTIFPLPLAQAGSHDFETIKRAAAIAARESYYHGLHCLFSPMLDLSRDPRWGRVMEGPGEDVYTAAQYGKAVVQGYQGDESKIKAEHVAACLKHFAGYSAVESGREYNTVDMSVQRLLNEYLVPYQEAIDANCRLVRLHLPC